MNTVNSQSFSLRRFIPVRHWNASPDAAGGAPMWRRPPMHRVNIYIHTGAHKQHAFAFYICTNIHIYIYTYVRSLRSANDGHIHRCHREEHSRGHYGNGNDPERDGRLKGKRTKRHKRRQGNCDRLIGATVKDDDIYIYICIRSLPH